MSPHTGLLSAIHTILKQYWGHDAFRPLQAEIIQCILEKKDALALLPTGGGKSVCYQVPAMAQEGLCLVISPLIALIKDQVENLKKRGILAEAIYSGMSRRQITQALKNAAHGPYKFLYVSPERVETALFKEYLPALPVNLIAVDEAHCISQWGYDFRPAYLKIGDLRTELPHVPLLAVTASATADVQQDICKQLGFKTNIIFKPSFERGNLSYSVFKEDAKMAKLIHIRKKVKGTAIIYCSSRKRTVEISNLLQMHGLSSHPYHAGLPAQVRSSRQQDWVSNAVETIVCTNAFGMGIDKPDVRLVIHADIPDCLENYYQEGGRAGRDGKKAYAVLLYDDNDIVALSGLDKIRFPSFSRIKEIYQALVNYLGIPVYTGEDTSYPFHFSSFVQNFKLPGKEALYAIKALEGDGWLVFNEQSFIPSTVVFTTSKQELYSFQEVYPLYEPLLTTLLRTYEGIFDFPASISENLLARLLKRKEEEIKEELSAIAAFRLITYAPQNEEPQIIFRKNRVPADELTFNLTHYTRRKESFAKRVETMIQYTATQNCRSRFINTYFGDEKSRPCGICDNCLSGKAAPLTAEEFTAISGQIIHALNQRPLYWPDLKESLKGITKAKAWQVVQFLQAEQAITTDGDGKLMLKKTSAFFAPGTADSQHP